MACDICDLDKSYKIAKFKSMEANNTLAVEKDVSNGGSATRRITAEGASGIPVDEEMAYVTGTEPTQPFPRRLSKYDSGWRYIVRNFTPSWFAVTMGTGIVAILLHMIPYESPALYYLSIIFFVLNTILFTLAMIVSILRYTLYPAIWGVMIRDPVNSLFLGCVPMGFATLINMWILVCVPAWGDWAKTVAFVLWIIDAVVSVMTTLCLPMMLMSRDDIRSLDRITAAQLLPIAATVVASGIGSKVAVILEDPQVTLGTVVASYILWGMSIPFAFIIIVIYYHRLVVHKLPPRETIVSAFLPLGPCGYSATILMLLGETSKRVLPQTGTLSPRAGDILHVTGFLTGLILWSFGLIWFFFALAALYRSGPIPFNMGWWGFTFPLGVYSAATLQLGAEMPSRFFRVLGTIFSIAVFLLWLVVAAATVKGAITRKLFYAPCLANLKPENEESE